MRKHSSNTSMCKPSFESRFLHLQGFRSDEIETCVIGSTPQPIPAAGTAVDGSGTDRGSYNNVEYDASEPKCSLRSSNCGSFHDEERDGPHKYDAL